MHLKAQVMLEMPKTEPGNSCIQLNLHKVNQKKLNLKP